MSIFGLLRHRNRSGARSERIEAGFHIRSRPAGSTRQRRFSSLRTVCFAKPVTASCMLRRYQYINGVRRRSRRYARVPRFLDKKRLGLGSVACSAIRIAFRFVAGAGMQWRLSIAKRFSCAGTFVAGSGTASLVGHRQSCGSTPVSWVNTYCIETQSHLLLHFIRPITSLVS
jgi:hypothetical protein